MSESTAGRRLAWGALTFGVVAPAMVLGIGYLNPWSEINCWHEEIDLHSGRIRTTWYLCFVPVSVRIEESAFSRALDSPLPVDADWHRVNTFSPGVRYSPHYTYHGAISQMNMVEDLWEYGHFTPEARRQSATQILSLWRLGGQQASDDYIRVLNNVAKTIRSMNGATELVDLPLQD